MRDVASMHVLQLFSCVLKALTTTDFSDPFIASLFSEEVELPEEQCLQCGALMEKRIASRAVGIQKVKEMKEDLNVYYEERKVRKCSVCGKEKEVTASLDIVKAPSVVVVAMEEQSGIVQGKKLFYKLK